MKNIAKVISLGIFVIILLATGGVVNASEPVQSASASLQSSYRESETDDVFGELLIKKTVISSVLENNNSPMQPYSWVFVATAAKYDLDPYLLPAIAKLESSYGRQILSGSYNPFGWNSGETRWDNWSEGIDHVGFALRTKYINRGAHTIALIGRKYASSPTWAKRVEKFMREFYNEETRLKGRMNQYLQASSEAGVAKLADAYGLEPYGGTLRGSSPLSGTGVSY